MMVLLTTIRAVMMAATRNLCFGEEVLGWLGAEPRAEACEEGNAGEWLALEPIKPLDLLRRIEC